MVFIYQISGVTSGSKVASVATSPAASSAAKVEREAFIKQILELWNKGDFDAAKDLAEKRLLTNANDALTHYILGKNYKLMFVADSDLVEFQKAAQLEPNNELYQIEALVTEASLKRLDANRLGQIISELTAFPETPLKLAALAFVSSLKDVVGERSPQNRKNMFKLIEQKYLNRAVTLLKNPSSDRWYDGVAYSLICDTYSQSGTLAEVPGWGQKVEWFRYKLMELGMPQAAQRYFIIKISNLMSANQLEEALKVAKSALDNNYGAIFGLYTTWLVKKTPNPRAVLESEVRTYYQKVTTGEPNNLRYRMNMADLLLTVANKSYQQRDLANGQKYAEEALKIVNQAKEILEKEQMDPKIFRKYGGVDLVEVYYYLGQVYEAMGNRDLAKKYYEDALNRPEQSRLKETVKTKLNNL